MTFFRNFWKVLSWQPFDMGFHPFYSCFGNSVRSVLVGLGFAFTFICLIVHIVNNFTSPLTEIISLGLS